MSEINPQRYQAAQDKSTRQAVNVSAIVKVIAFDPNNMTVDVQPLSKYLEGGIYQSHPPILGVPVAVTKSGGFIYRPWINENDIGLVVYVDHDIDRAVLEGRETEPNTERNHSASDAVFVGGIVPGNAPVTSLPAGAAVLATENGRTYIAVTPSRVQIKGNLYIDGNVEASGNITPHT